MCGPDDSAGKNENIIEKLITHMPVSSILGEPETSTGAIFTYDVDRKESVSALNAL